MNDEHLCLHSSTTIHNETPDPATGHARRTCNYCRAEEHADVYCDHPANALRSRNGGTWCAGCERLR